VSGRFLRIKISEKQSDKLAFTGVKLYHVRPFSLNKIQLKSIINRVCHRMSDSNLDPKNNSNSAEPKPVLNFLLLSAGSIFTSMIVAGFLVGYALDQLFDTTPIFLLGCALLGFIGGIQKVHKLTSRMDMVSQERKDDQKS
jgi:ATP synthase protein I